MKKNKIKGVTLISVILFFIYLLFFPRITGKELVLIPRWNLDLSGATPSAAFQGKAVPFRQGDRFGYVTSLGELIYLGDVQYNITMTEKKFINYSGVQSLQQNLISFSPGGQMLNTLSLSGYPLLKGDRFFLVNLTGTGVSEVDQDGVILWEMDRTKFITTMAVGKNLLALGFSNGLIELLDNKGESLYQLKPDNSRLPVILGSAMTGGENRFAFICGIDPQYLVYVEKKEEQFLEPLYIELKSDFRREVIISFTASGEYILFEGSDELISYNTNKGKISFHSLDGGLESLILNEDESLVTLINPLDRERKSLAIAAPGGEQVFKDSFTTRDQVFSIIKEKVLIMGIEDNLLGLELLEL